MSADPLTRHLTTADFARALEVSEETVRRYIRANTHGLRRKFCHGRPWKINPAALALFNVTPELARALLTQPKAA